MIYLTCYGFVALFLAILGVLVRVFRWAGLLLGFKNVRAMAEEGYCVKKLSRYAALFFFVLAGLWLLSGLVCLIVTLPYYVPLALSAVFAIFAYWWCNKNGDRLLRSQPADHE